MPRDIELILVEQLSSCLAVSIFVVDPQGDLLFYNESAEPLVGQRFEEAGALGLTEWSDRLQSTDESGRILNDDERPMVAALQRREPVHRDFFLHGMDGKRRELQGTALPLIGEEGRLLGVLGFFWEPDSSDLPAEKPAPSRGRGRQQHVEAILMRRLASYLTTPIYLINSDGDVIYLNKAAERLVGRSLEEMLALSQTEIFQAFRAKGLDGTELTPGQIPMTMAYAQNRPAHLRYYNHDKEGVPRLVEGTAFPLVGQTGHNLGVVGVFWEIDAS